MSNIEYSRIAAKQLGLDPDSHTIAYLAHEFNFIRDIEDIMDLMDGELVFSDDEIRDSIEAGSIRVVLPEQYVLVGMRELGGDASSPRTFGIVRQNENNGSTGQEPA